ncbi:MAG: N-6 DNA methylase [Bacteroidaceae bacterium]|nr:N-6 DNA methylase [Bacteroidaceae bacterium]
MSYDANKELQPLIKELTTFSYQNGKNITDVFDDFLLYIIYGFDCTFKKVEGWNYTPVQTQSFGRMFAEWVRIMEKALRHRDWYDAFGDIYMELISSKMRQQGNGQFFTPHTICDFMAKITINEGEHTGKINDCACGSGRCLLAANAISPGNYYVGQDIDKTCCLMTVCNFIIHGMVGEVIWGDALNPANFHGAWKTNEMLKYGTPSVRYIDRCESEGYLSAISALINKEDKQEAKQSKPKVAEPVAVVKKSSKASKAKSEYEQMSLFDGLW